MAITSAKAVTSATMSSAFTSFKAIRSAYMYSNNTNHAQRLEIIKKNIFPYTLWVFKNYCETFSSDLRKPCLITGKSLSPLTKISPVHEKYLATLSKTG